MRKDTVSREVLRHPEFKDSVELSRVRDFFLCEFIFAFLFNFSDVLSSWFKVNVESEGAYSPERMLPEAIKVMREKLKKIRQAAEALYDQVEVDGDVTMADV